MKSFKKRGAAFAVLFIIVFIFAIFYIAFQSISREADLSKQQSIEDIKKQMLGSQGEMLKAYTAEAVTFSTNRVLIDRSKNGVDRPYWMTQSRPTMPTIIEVNQLIQPSILMASNMYLSSYEDTPFGRIIVSGSEGAGTLDNVILTVNGNFLRNGEYDSDFPVIATSSNVGKIVSPFQNEERIVEHGYEVQVNNRFWLLYRKMGDWLSNSLSLNTELCGEMTSWLGFGPGEYYVARQADLEKILYEKIEQLESTFNDPNIECRGSIQNVDFRSNIIAGEDADCDGEPGAGGSDCGLRCKEGTVASA